MRHKEKKMITTREQDEAAELMSATYGRCAVQATVFHYATGSVILTGLTDDVERDKVVVMPNGELSACWDLTSLFLQRYLEVHAQDKRPQLLAVNAEAWIGARR